MSDALATPSEEELPPGRFWGRVMFAPLVLSLVAVHQIQLAHSSLLSPWKGGGFGMFATADSPTARCVRVYLVHGNREAPLNLPESFFPIRNRLATDPTPDRAEDLARLIAAQSWSRDDIRQRKIGLETRLLSETAEASLLRPETPLERVPAWPDAGLESPVVLGKGYRDERMPFEAVRVEVWFRTFDAASKQLLTEKQFEAIAKRSSR